jgi:alkanesulfonate monooxygenase SsuD/methylene tetrahydromethanopterin reductase-like flavin-dependent oxidoreductase (luciferase family)
MADWGSVVRMMAIKNLTPQTLGDKVFAEKRMYFASRAIGGYPFVGSPDRIADELADLSRSGVRGIAFSMINYLNELPLFRDEVLPRLERHGVRAAHN